MWKTLQFLHRGRACAKKDDHDLNNNDKEENLFAQEIHRNKLFEV